MSTKIAFRRNIDKEKEWVIAVYTDKPNDTTLKTVIKRMPSVFKEIRMMDKLQKEFGDKFSGKNKKAFTEKEARKMVNIIEEGK
jgi:hypothetical protein